MNYGELMKEVEGIIRNIVRSELESIEAGKALTDTSQVSTDTPEPQSTEVEVEEKPKKQTRKKKKEPKPEPEPEAIVEDDGDLFGDETEVMTAEEFKDKLKGIVGAASDTTKAREGLRAFIEKQYEVESVTNVPEDKRQETIDFMEKKYGDA